jgi:hypothetical protein
MNKRGQSMKSKISPASPFRKKAQTQISFGVIFSIFLIIVFIAFAIYGIGKFLELKNIAEIEKFKTDFQGDIDKMWKGSGDQEVTAGPYYLPNKIKQVCFVNDEYENIQFVPDELDDGFKGDFLEHVDIAKSVASSRTNPKKLCMDTLGGKISIGIKKAYNEDFVTITKP